MPSTSSTTDAADQALKDHKVRTKLIAERLKNYDYHPAAWFAPLIVGGCVLCGKKIGPSNLAAASHLNIHVREGKLERSLRFELSRSCYVYRIAET